MAVFDEYVCFIWLWMKCTGFKIVCEIVCVARQHTLSHTFYILIHGQMKHADSSKTTRVWEAPKTATQQLTLLFYQSGVSSPHGSLFYTASGVCQSWMISLWCNIRFAPSEFRQLSRISEVPTLRSRSHLPAGSSTVVTLLTGISVRWIQILASSLNWLHFSGEACQNQATKKKGCMRTKERGDLPSSVTVQQWIWIYVTTILVPTSARALSSASTSNITIHNLAFDWRGKERREKGRRQNRGRRKRREERSMKSDH